MKITQHRPAYFSGFENETVKFNTVEELLDIPFVAHFSRIGTDFYRYSINRGENLLMCERAEGTVWWVIGRLDPDARSLDLPEWQPVYKQKNDQAMQQICFSDRGKQEC